MNTFAFIYSVLFRNVHIVVCIYNEITRVIISLVLTNSFLYCTGSVNCLRILKFLIPASVVPQESIVRGVSWLCMGKLPMNAQVLIN